MDRIPGVRTIMALVAFVGLPALWLVPEGPEEKGVMEGTGWTGRAEVGLWGGQEDPEAIASWGEARRAFCAALGEAEWLATLGRAFRLLTIPEGVVLGGAVVLLVLSLGAQLGRVGEGWRIREVLVEWTVHLAMAAALGATYLAVFGVVLALRRAEGRRATVLALAVVARVAFPVLSPLLCLEGGAEWVRAPWEAVRRFFL